MYQDLEKILLTQEELRGRIAELGALIEKDYCGEPVLMVGILKGAAPFFVALSQEVKSQVYYDFMAVSSYGAGTSSSGEVKIIKDIAQPIEGKNVLIVEDIIDSGRTLAYLKRVLWQRNPKSLKICTLLDKPERREVEIEVDYRGFIVPNEFVVGFGLDYNEQYRNLPEIGVLKREVYDR